MMELLSVTFLGLFLSNVLVTNLVGLPLFEKHDVSLKRPFKIGLLTTVLALLTVILAYPINKYLLEPEGMNFLYPLVAILIIANLYLLVNVLSEKIGIDLDENKTFIPITSFNAIVIFVALFSTSQVNYLTSIFYVLGAGLGYMLIMLMIGAMKPRLELPGMPKAFKGLPITLITLGLIGLTFLGLAGLL